MDSNSIPTYTAPPKSDRTSIVIQEAKRVGHQNQVPSTILEDEFLVSLVSESLPKNYNFEIFKTIWKIKQINARSVILQFPEGLIRFGPVIVDIISAYFSKEGQDEVRFIIMGDLTYGACCIDDYLAISMGCDLIVHYAHSCLVPINTMSDKTKYLYVFLDIKFDLNHLKRSIEHNFDPKSDVLAIASTIQFVSSVHELAKHLRTSGFEVVLPQSRPLSSAEVIGCTAPRLDSKVNKIIFVCDGRFHLEALMIANPKIEAFRYDPYSRKLTSESYNFEKMYELRHEAIMKAVDTLRTDGSIGIVLGTLGRQGNESVFQGLSSEIKKVSSCNISKFLLPEVNQNVLDKIEGVGVWVQVACPRLSIDWGHFYKAPLLNTYELARAIKIVSGKMDQKPAEVKEYPMDYYAKFSCGTHTPNHTCERNPNCLCSSGS